MVLALCGLVVETAAGGAETEWPRLVAPDSGFAISMPGPFERQQKTTDNPSGPIVTTIWLTKDGTSLYLAGVTDYPVDISPQKELSLDRDNFLKAVDAKLVSETPIMLGGNAGLEFTGASANQRYHSRVFVVGTRRSIQIAVRQDLSSLDDQKTARFFQSFQLNPKL